MCWFLVSLVEAQDAGANDKTPEEILIETARNPEADFFEAYEIARDAGVSEAYLLQARIVKMLQTGDLKGLLGLIDKIEKHRPDFDVGFDPTGEKQYLFSADREVGAMLDTLKAIKAFQAEDYETFEELVLGAYWNGPTWPQIFRLHELVQQLHTTNLIEEYVDDLVLPLDMEIRDLHGEVMTLQHLISDHKAVLLDFWASWCGPCMRLMPELQKRSENLSEQGIFVAAVNTDDEAPLEKARQTKEEKEMDMPWLVEAEGMPLSKALIVTSIPRMVLISPKGEVLFSGHPMDEKLDTALLKLGVTPPEA